MIIRDEAPADRDAIGAVHNAAFAGTYEAELVEKLRATNLTAVSIVAEVKDEIVGHILLSRIEAECAGRPLLALALAPLAVVPARQRQGIGTSLVHAAIAAARNCDAQLILVLGHPDFYRSFGFSSRKAENLVNPFQTEAFMALELVPDLLSGRAGFVRYPVVFGLEEHEELP